MGYAKNWPRYLSAVVVLFIVLTSCSKREEVNSSPAPTPCSGLAKTLYSFKIENNIYGHFFECDTTFPNVIRLSANSTYTDVKWLVGVDVFTGSETDVTFNSAVGTVPIVMIGQRPLNTACFPHDDGVDTLTKYLTVVPLDPNQPKAAIEGKFLGSTAAAPSDTFTIRILTGPDPLFPYRKTIQLLNLNKGCPGTAIDINGGYKGLVFNQSIVNQQCHGVSGTAYLDPENRNKIHVEYSETGSASLAKNVFTGVRVR